MSFNDRIVSRRDFIGFGAKTAASVLAMGGLAGCDNGGKTHAKSIKNSSIKYPKWKFAYVADIQVGSPKSFRFAPSWNENWQTARKQIIEMEPDFLLVGGDLTRDGYIHKFELEAIKADLDSLGFPYYVIPGNMDVGNKHTDVNGVHRSKSGTIEPRKDIELNATEAQLKQFEDVFGPLWWSIVHKNLRVSGFCDVLMGSGLPQEKQLWDWLESQEKLPRAEHHIWLMHYALFINDINERNFDITDPDEYLSWYFGVDLPWRRRVMEVFKATGADRVITGHIHCRKDHFAEGVNFDLAPATCFSQFGDHWPDGDPRLGFFMYEVNDDLMEKAFIPLAKLSDKKGYGPKGHPSPDKRDYSIAWEK